MRDEITINFLGLVADKLNPSTLKELREGTLRIDDGEIYIKADVTGFGGTVAILDSDTVKQSGITNVDKGSLESLVNLVVKSLSFGHAKGSNLSAKEAVTKPYMTDDIPSAIVNAELVLKIEDKPVFRQRVKSIMPVSADSFTNERDCFDLENFKLIAGDTPFSIELDFNGQNVPTVSDEKHIVEVSLYGGITKKN
ncbi:hypothetical protein [Aureibacter tunicatorum]|uniref:Uncharacterized protein n=1 Tax=Aureibacter tunicatorum TaxID=866807 RepID=A0AAE3XR68_9BACT|nr:hypothetical protein [Aureibacter tunicatorum]MDR6239944.1 hypothetical protein [Aureibacter tunicatorum]BDD04418.1 hypothetical protein AUTU_19010 [Aureibacter tunicatorum]